MRFDLRSQHSLPNVRSMRRVQLVIVIGWILYATTVVYGCVASYVRHDGFAGWPAAQTMVLVDFSLLSGVSAFILLAAGAPPLSVEVSPTGVVFEFKGHRTWRVAWADPKLSFRVSRTDGTLQHGVLPPQLIVVMGRFARRNYLTREAYDEILRQAALLRLRVDDVPGPRPGWFRTTIGPPLG